MPHPAAAAAADVVAVATLQFSWGGLLNSRTADHRIHLVRMTRRGTPGPTLCGIDRFAKDAPGWSVGGGVTDPDSTACTDCDAAAPAQLPLWGDFASLFPHRDAAPWSVRDLPAVPMPDDRAGHTTERKN